MLNGDITVEIPDKKKLIANGCYMVTNMVLLLLVFICPNEHAQKPETRGQMSVRNSSTLAAVFKTGIDRDITHNGIMKEILRGISPI